MRISIFKLAAYYLYQVIATDASKEDKKAKDRDTESPNPENTDCNNNVTYMIDKNLSKKPVPFASSDFRNWAKDHNLMILQETYTLVNPGKVAETPGSVLEGLDKAANAPGKADVENLYLPKPDFDYTEGYGPKSKESKNKKPDSKKDDDKKKSGEDSGEGDKDKDKTKDKGASDQKGANDQKNPEQKGANDQKQQPSQQQSGGAQKKRKSPDSSSSSSSDDDMKEAGPGGQNKKAKKSKLKAGFLPDDSFLKGSSWKSSFLKSNI